MTSPNSLPQPSQDTVMNDKRTIKAIDALAQEIRRVDGENSLGAGALAEALQPFLTEPQHRREASSPALKVKPLEWHGPDFEDEYWAASLDLKYVIHPPNERGVRWLGGVGGYFRLVDEAKAVAEKHNEARIRSALGEHP